MNVSLPLIVILAFRVTQVYGSALKDLSEIRYRITNCGEEGRHGPDVEQCKTWYEEHNSSIITEDSFFKLLDETSRIYRGSQVFRVQKTGFYNITVAGAAGGRGVCSIGQGMGLLWNGIVHLSNQQNLLMSIGHMGLETCKIRPDIPVCSYPPSTFNDSHQCLIMWNDWLMSNPQLSQSDASTSYTYGGGGGGGGASMLRIQDQKTGVFNRLPMVVAGGGGGSASYSTSSFLSKLNIPIPSDAPPNASEYDLYLRYMDAKHAIQDTSLVQVHNISGIRGYIGPDAEGSNQRPGVGGGYFNAISLQQDGSALSEIDNFAVGGYDCLKLTTDLTRNLLLDGVHGGFGGGGGQCESGGSGGGYTGGSVFSNLFFGIPGNGGYYAFFSDQNNVTELSVRLNTEQNGYVEIMPVECGCGYMCVMDDDMVRFRCLCSNETELAPNGFDCFKGVVVDIKRLETRYQVGEDFASSYIQFNTGVEVFSVYSEVTLSQLDDSVNISQSGDLFCVVLFLDLDGDVVLASNPVSTQFGAVNHLSTIDSQDFETFLSKPYSIAGLLLVSDQNCTLNSNLLQLNITQNEFDVGQLSNTTLDMENIYSVARNFQRLNKLSTELNEPSTVTTILPVSSSQNIYLAISVSIGGVIIIVMTLSILLFALCHHHTRKKKIARRRLHNIYSSVNKEGSMVRNKLYHGHAPNLSTSIIDNEDDSEVEDCTSPRSGNEGHIYDKVDPKAEVLSQSFAPRFDVYVPEHNFSSYYLQIDATNDIWEYPRNRLIYMKQLGEGQFGKVLLMKAHGIANFHGKLPVAVKTLSSTDPVVVKKFSEEANLMKTFSHPNIISLLGISFEDVDQNNAPLMILEYMPFGDLNNFLKKHRPDSAKLDPEESNIETGHFYSFARDIADGLAFLSSRCYIHGDIASRNCLVGPSLTIKIGDFGLSKKVPHDGIYRLEENAVLPLRWLSPESLTFGIFSYASDVWSFGVLLWEIVSYGDLPLEYMSNDTIIDMAEKKNLHHIRPLHCPDDLHAIMMQCHQQSPKNRITITDIVKMLPKENLGDNSGSSCTLSALL